MQLPVGFIENMKSLLGDEPSSALFAALSEEPVVSLRLNPLKRVPWDKIIGFCLNDRVEWSENGFYLEQRPVFSLNPLLHAGAFYVQDASSMVFESLTDIALQKLSAEDRKVSVLDMCAAPGGKSTAVISRLPEGSVICANEFIPQRCSILKENLIKWGYPDVVITNSSTDRFSGLELFDIVIVDAPCSGEGMMRKDEDAVAQWSESLISQCAALQRRILEDAVGALKPGGILIYSTCTFNKLEDEDNVRYIAGKYALSSIDTGLVGVGGILPGVDPDFHALRFMPHSTRGEGLFVAMLQKPDVSSIDPVNSGDCYEKVRNLASGSDYKSGSLKNKDKKSDCRRKKGSDKGSSAPELLKYLSSAKEYILFEKGEEIWALSPATNVILTIILSADIKVVSAGIPLGLLKGKDYAPHPLLPLSIEYNSCSLPDVILNEEEALNFLRKESLISPPDTPRGFVTVSFNGVHLGLMKNIGSRANNLWPSQLKLRIK